MPQEYPVDERSEEEWLKLSGVKGIYREREGSGGRRENSERGQSVRSLVFIPGPETFWRPISLPERRRQSFVQRPELLKIKFFIDA